MALVIFTFLFMSFQAPAVTLEAGTVKTLTNLAKNYCGREFNSTVDVTEQPDCIEPMTERECRMFLQLNFFRSLCSRDPLEPSRACTLSAREHTRYLSKIGKLVHVRGRNRRRIRELGAPASQAGENIALQSISSSTLMAMTSLIRSKKGHRGNILHKSYRYAGIGKWVNSKRTLRYWAQCFYW